MTGPYGSDIADLHGNDVAGPSGSNTASPSWEGLSEFSGQRVKRGLFSDEDSRFF